MPSTNISRTKTRRKLSLSIQVFTAPIITILIIIVSIVLHQRLLVIRIVTCQMGDSACPDGVLVLLDRTRGKSILQLDQKDLQKQILSTGLVDRIKLSPKLPGKLVATGEPPAISFLVKTTFGKIIPDMSFLTSSTSAAPSIELNGYVASMEGKIFQLLSTGVLNQSAGDSSFYLISQSIPDKNYLAKTFDWLHSFALSSMKPDTIFFLSDMIILKQNDQPDLIMNFWAAPDDVILALQRINQVITIKKPTLIDFRYSHPILK